MRTILGGTYNEKNCRCHISPPCNSCVTEDECPECGEGVESDLNNCPECGTELEPKE